MKAALIVSLALAACLQVETRAIAKRDLPKVLQETMEQSFSCALQMGSRARHIPRVAELNLLPEDNESLQELWGCLFEKKKILNEGGNVSEDHLYSYLTDMFSLFEQDRNDVEDLARMLTDNCKGVEADNAGLKAVRIENCLKKKIKNV